MPRKEKPGARLYVSAYILGQKTFATKGGTSRLKNPYTTGSEEASGWFDGWDAAWRSDWLHKSGSRYRINLVEV